MTDIRWSEKTQFVVNMLKQLCTMHIEGETDNFRPVISCVCKSYFQRDSTVKDLKYFTYKRKKKKSNKNDLKLFFSRYLDGYL